MIMRKIAALLLTAILAVSICACSNSKKSSDAEVSKASAIQSTTEAEEVYIIKTDYADLSYPVKWQNKVNVEVSNDKVSFSTADKKVKLFDLCFGGNNGYVVGKLNDKKSVELRAVSYNIDSKLNDFDEYCAMQEDMNVIIHKLINDGKLVE